MTLKLLLLGGAALALTAGGAEAAKSHNASRHASTATGAYAPPSQPIPYSQVDSYVKGNAKQKAAIVATASQADTGTAANTSATAAAPPPADQTAPSAAPAPVNPAPNTGDTGAAAGSAPATQDNMGATGATPPAPPAAGGTTNAPAGTPQSGPTGQPGPQ